MWKSKRLYLGILFPSFKGDILNASMTVDEYMLTGAFVRSDVVRQH